MLPIMVWSDEYKMVSVLVDETPVILQRWRLVRACRARSVVDTVLSLHRNGVNV